VQRARQHVRVHKLAQLGHARCGGAPGACAHPPAPHACAAVLLLSAAPAALQAPRSVACVVAQALPQCSSDTACAGSARGAAASTHARGAYLTRDGRPFRLQLKTFNVPGATRARGLGSP
jgi:hypothetical protein